MARPEYSELQNGVAAWDAVVNGNFEKVFANPYPIPLHSGDEADLEATYPAASHDKCWIYVNHTVYGWTIYESDGASWAIKEFGGGGGGGTSVLAPLAVAVSDEVTTIIADTDVITFRMPADFTLTEIFCSLTTASSSGLVTVDVNKGGVSILSTKITIDASEKTSLTAATPPVISTSDFSQDDEITVDIDGAGTGAKGLKLYMVGVYNEPFADYSSSEVVTGVHWVDGDPIYRKTVSCTLPNANTTTNAHSCSDVETIVRIEGRYLDGSSNTHPLPRAATTDNDNIEVYANTTNIYLKSGGNHSGGSACTVDIYYTKTTD
jgi:hypothetical protein